MIDSLNEKQIRFLEWMLEQKNRVEAEEIAGRLGLSVRTVMRYTASLNQVLKPYSVSIEVRRGQGYYLAGDRHAVRELLKRAGSGGQEIQNRVRDFLLELLEQEEATIEQLSDSLYVSPSTLNKLTGDVKKFLQKYHLKLKGKPYYGLSVSGRETDIRTLLGDIGLTQHNAALVNTGIRNLSEAEFAMIDQVVFRYLHDSGLVVADMDLNYLIARIAISLSRSKKRRYMMEFALPSPVMGHNYQMIQSIMTELGERMGISFPVEECQYVMLYSGFIGYDFTLADTQANSEMYRFVERFMDEISEMTGIQYGREETVMNILSMHLNALLQRARAGRYSMNPIIEQIKNNYPVEMNYAILMAQRFEEEFGVAVNEDEIGYLTVYLGAYQPKDDQLDGKEQKKAMILCNYGIGTSQMILEKLKTELEEINILGVYPVRYLPMALEKKADVIISAVRIDGYNGPAPLIVAEDLLSSQAQEYIRDQIWRLVDLQEELIRYFDEACFARLLPGDRYSIIRQLSQVLKGRKLVDDSVLEGIERRERISSTEIGNLVAIPHVLCPGGFQSCIAIGILEKPVLWEKEMVQLVFLACFNQTDDRSATAFRTLYKVIRSPDMVGRLLTARAYGEFIEIMKKGERR